MTRTVRRDKKQNRSTTHLQVVPPSRTPRESRAPFVWQSDARTGTGKAGAPGDQTRNTLDERGAFRSLADKRIFGIKSVDEIMFHGNSTQHRFGEGPSP